MTAKTECLQIGPIPEQFRITVVFHDVINGEVGLDGSTLRACVGRINQHGATELMPWCVVIPAPHVHIRARSLARKGMLGAASSRDEGCTARHHTVTLRCYGHGDSAPGFPTSSPTSIRPERATPQDHASTARISMHSTRIVMRLSTSVQVWAVACDRARESALNRRATSR